MDIITTQSGKQIKVDHTLLVSAFISLSIIDKDHQRFWEMCRENPELDDIKEKADEYIKLYSREISQTDCILDQL